MHNRDGSKPSVYSFFSDGFVRQSCRAAIRNRPGVMFEGTLQTNETSAPLALASGGRIVSSGMIPVMGWIDGDRSLPAQPLIFPPSLLEPFATTDIVYACNLPAAGIGTGNKASGPLPLGPSGTLPDIIEPVFEAEFLMASLPGGQTWAMSRQGERSAVKFRWLCITAHATIGAVWRCFVQTRTPRAFSPWRAIEHDYVFEAGGGLLLNAPGILTITPEDFGGVLTLSHPDRRVTSLPCRAGRVKVTLLKANGWTKRELVSLSLCVDHKIIARLSDGAQVMIATAASACQPVDLAA